MESFAVYLERWVATPGRVLEVGAGSGALAAQLRDRGHAVTAIDPDATGGTGVQPASIETFQSADAFDVVVAQRSLHHVADLDVAIAAIAELVTTGGLVVAEEFCWDLLDDATGRWLHHHSRRLGLDVADDPEEFLSQWRAELADLATFSQLRARLADRFQELEFAWIPYLAWEYLHDDAAATESEHALLARHELSPVAFRYAGRRS